MASDIDPQMVRLDIRQAAAVLGYSVRQLKALIENGILPLPDLGDYGALAGFSAPGWVELAKAAIAANPERASNPRYSGRREREIRPQAGVTEIPA